MIVGKAKKIVEKKRRSANEKKIMKRIKNDIQDLRTEKLLNYQNEKKQELTNRKAKEIRKIAEKYDKKENKLHKKHMDNNIHLLHKKGKKKWELKKDDLKVEQKKELLELKNKRKKKEDKATQKFFLEEQCLEQKHEEQRRHLINPIEEKKLVTFTERCIENLDYNGDGSGSENGDTLSGNMDEDPIATHSSQKVVYVFYKSKISAEGIHTGIGDNLTEERDSEQEKKPDAIPEVIKYLENLGPYIGHKLFGKCAKKIKKRFPWSKK